MGKNRPAPWAERSGYEKMANLLKVRGTLEIATSLEEWCKTKKMAISKVRFRCIECKVESDASINNVSRGQHISCRCNRRAVRWDTDAGFGTFSNHIFEHGIELVSLYSTELWKAASIGKKSKIELACTFCGVSAWSKVDHIMSGHGIRCYCTGGPEWKSKDGYNRALKIVEDHPRFKFSGVAPSFEQWTSGHLSRIECSECSMTIDISPHEMKRSNQQCAGFACLCINRSEKDMYNILKPILPDNLRIVVHAPYTHVVGSGGGTLRCDFAILQAEDVLLYVEVDGGYHFGLADAHPRSKHSGMTMRHDILKETNCPSPIVRVCADTVRKDPSGTRQWVQTLLELACRGALKGVHRWSVRELYSKSTYASMRADV